MMLETGGEIPHKQEFCDILRKIETQAHRAGEIIRRLRKLVVRRESQFQHFDIRDAIHEVTALMNVDLQKMNVRLKIEADEDLPLVSADRIQIEQVILNLTRNAMESMSSSNTDQPQLDISATKTTAETLEISISDNGPGIKQEDRERVFEQFYSTKAEGMGMGLSISSTIVEAHGGRLYATDAPPTGARFCFTLPIQDEGRSE